MLENSINIFGAIFVYFKHQPRCTMRPGSTPVSLLYLPLQMSRAAMPAYESCYTLQGRQLSYNLQNSREISNLVNLEGVGLAKAQRTDRRMDSTEMESAIAHFLAPLIAPGISRQWKSASKAQSMDTDLKTAKSLHGRIR